MNYLARHIEGCSLNPLEFVLGDDGKPKVFDTPDMARDFYLAAGGTPTDLEESYVLITDTDGNIL
jgi:hypothetical protein